MNENDLRVRRTKKLLMESLVALLEVKPFSDIGVQLICEKAMVHRTTFYKHYYDKFDLLQNCLQTLADDYFALDFEKRINEPFQSLAQITAKFPEKIGHMQEEDKQFYDTLLKDTIIIIGEDIRKNIDRLEFNKIVPESLVFYLYGSTIHAMIEWEKQVDVKKKPYELDEIFKKVSPIKVKSPQL